MRILVVCQYYAPEPFRLPDICQELEKQGHSVTVVTGTPNYPEGEIYPGYGKGERRDEILQGVRVHRCPLIPRKQGTIFRLLNYFSFPISASWYLRGLREEFDVVLVNQLSPVMMAWPALSWAKRHKKQCLLYCLDLWPESLLAGGISRESFVYRMFAGISRRIYRRADAIAITSQGFERYLRQELGLGEKEICYLPQYAEALFDSLPAPPEKTGVDVLFAGNVGTAQSVETIVEAAKILREETHIRIHIAGSGAALESCRQQAQGLPGLIFHGRLPLEEMPRLYAMADAFLVTMVADETMERTLPGKVQSYLAGGKPLIGAIGGETARVIREGNCGLCGPAEDAQTLAENIRKMALSQEDRRIFGENARTYYEQHFRKERFMQTLTELLQTHCKEESLS